MRRRRSVSAPGWMSLLLSASLSLASVAQALATEVVIYGFEHGEDGWVLPDWAKASNDYVATAMAVSQERAVEGHASLRLETQFPGGRWTGSYVERQVETTDWSPFHRLSLRIFLPPEAPRGLRGKIILTVGDQWRWTEQNRAVPLVPGRWTTVSVGLVAGSLDWKFFPDESFRKNIKKLGVRIESDKGPAYQGPVFLDDVCLAG